MNQDSEWNGGGEQNADSSKAVKTISASVMD